MIHKRKIIAYIICIISLLFAAGIIAGCGGGSGSSGGGGTSATAVVNNPTSPVTPVEYGTLEVWAYEDTESTKGTRPLRGALVTVVGAGSKWAYTDSAGYARIIDIETGSYCVTITKAGYDSYSNMVTISTNLTSAVGTNEAPVALGLSTNPAVANVTPTKALVGNEVVISGVNFGTEEGTVKFIDPVYNKEKNLTVITWSDTEIICEMVAGVSSGYIYVYNSSNDISRPVKNVKSGPSINLIANLTRNTSNSGSISDVVMIHGSGFGDDATAVSIAFNGTSAVVTNCSPYQLVCSVPSGAATGNVVVTASGASSTGLSFTVNGNADVTVQ
ncbi:MAG: IPT/TIG domain-containing protein [Armatimonadota bacterium]